MNAFNKRNVLTRIVPASLGLALAFGCTPKPDTEGEATPVLKDEVLTSTNGAARILEKSEVEAFYGVPFEDVKAGGGTPESLEMGISTCNYQAVDDPSKTVAIYLTPISSMTNVTNAAEAYEQTQKQLTKQSGFQVNMSLVPIEGIGEKAGWLPMLEQLWVFNGNYYFVLMCAPATNKSVLQSSQDLAKMALARMPKD